MTPKFLSWTIYSNVTKIKNIRWAECAENEHTWKLKYSGSLTWEMSSQKKRGQDKKVNLRVVLVEYNCPNYRGWSRNLYLAYLGGDPESRIERLERGR